MSELAEVACPALLAQPYFEKERYCQAIGL